MVFFIVAIKVLLFAFCFAAGIAVLVFVPACIYTIPYALWMGSENTKGKQLDKKNAPFWTSVKNATKLYKAWITRQEPSF